jgi:SAM-dependent methyltransferase
MDSITRQFKQHYFKKFAEFGATPRGVDWNRKEDVELRQDILLNVILPEATPKNKQITILDVGCGYGGLYWYAKDKKQLKLRYTGIDVAENMIEYAAPKAPEAEFICQDIFDFPDKTRFDYVVCNGILTQKLTASIKDMDKFAYKLIKKMFKLCKVGIAFNVMSTQVNFMVDNLYYKSPVELFAFCQSEITSKIKIDHSYPLYEYTVYLYQEATRK